MAAKGVEAVETILVALVECPVEQIALAATLEALKTQEMVVVERHQLDREQMV